MSNENEGGIFNCPVMCWIIGALLGVATYLVLSGRFEMGMIISLIAALIVVAAAGILLGRMFCQDQTAAHSHTARHDQDIAATRKDVADVGNIGGADLAMPPSVPEVAAVTSSTAAMDASTSKADSAAKGEKSAAKPKAKAAAKTRAKPKAAAKPKAKAAAKKPATKTASKPASKPVAKDGKPEMLTAARASGADDLKQIKGVGPKMQTMLNEMGIYHFDQVSGWRPQEVKWVDENLKGFKGRVSRDEWVKQAKILAKGGQTEFSKKVEKGGVYDKNKK